MIAITPYAAVYGARALFSARGSVGLQIAEGSGICNVVEWLLCPPFLTYISTCCAFWETRLFRQRLNFMSFEVIY